MSEVRLIDSNAAISAFADMGQDIDTHDVIDLLKEQPTVDAVPVCRCCDCKWCEYPAHNSTKYGCKLFDRCVKPDWFCADGKEKIDG